jgi:hypothetical protein
VWNSFAFVEFPKSFADTGHKVDAFLDVLPRRIFWQRPNGLNRDFFRGHVRNLAALANDFKCAVRTMDIRLSVGGRIAVQFHRQLVRLENLP